MIKILYSFKIYSINLLNVKYLYLFFTYSLEKESMGVYQTGGSIKKIIEWRVLLFPCIELSRNEIFEDIC